MSTHGKVKVLGPNAANIVPEVQDVVSSTIPPAADNAVAGEAVQTPNAQAGTEGELSAEVMASAKKAFIDAITKQAEAEEEEAPPTKDPDMSFPFGIPEDIDWDDIDLSGHELLKEVNLRTWMKSVEYCSGHPLDAVDPHESDSELYTSHHEVMPVNVYDEIHKLDLAYLRGLLPDVYFRHRKSKLREMGATRFYLNLNVYNDSIFQEWTRLLAGAVSIVTQTYNNPVIVRYNPLRPGVNYTIYWDYWVNEERKMIHDLALQTLKQLPV